MVVNCISVKLLNFQKYLQILKQFFKLKKKINCSSHLRISKFKLFLTLILGIISLMA